MIKSDIPITRELVLIGGGHTHALVLRSWAMKPVPGVRLTLINPGPAAPYSGMLPGMVAGHYRQEDLQIDLVRLARVAGARLVLGRATGIDRDTRLITVPGHAEIYYDIASVDIGITSDLPDLPGFIQHATPAKPLGAFADRWEAFVSTATGTSPRVLVIGAGVAGVELALAASHRLAKAGLAGQVDLVEAGPNALRDIGDGARRALLAQLVHHGVTLHTDARIDAVLEDGVRLQGGRMLPADLVIGAAGARPQGWLADTGLKLHDGFITIGPDLTSLNDPAIYAVGDCAHMGYAPRPKAGVYAVRQAPVLLHNLRADLTGGTRRSYQPQSDYLKLISTGSQRAVADKFGLRLEGGWLWRWKNRIDQRFMAQFRQMQPMTGPRVADGAALGVAEIMGDGQPVCGGCAAKPGVDALQGGLAALPAPQRPEVLTGPGDDAAILKAGDGFQVMTTDHFRAFWDDPYLLGRIAAVHALGDIWAMGATPQVALAQVTLPRMRPRLQQHLLRELLQGASELFASEGVDIVGGHTAQGAELMVGFTLTGHRATAPIGQGGAKPGDALILTRPVGSGIIFAAEMQGRAPGAVVAGALAQLSQTQAPAAAVLAGVASAMTDVTGYGLAGHLLGILQASNLSAELSVQALPVLPGARALAEAGVRSSLHSENTRVLQNVIGRMPDADAALLCDPQTAGGLLAAVPGDQAAQVLQALHDIRVDAVQIGSCTPGTGTITIS